MKCFKCKIDIPEKKVEKEVSVMVKNKKITISGKVVICPQCGEAYSSEDDSFDFFDAFDKECKKQGVE